MAKQTTSKKIESFLHMTDKRRNIPTAEYQSMVSDETRKPILISYEKRNPDLDPQLIWRGKYEGDETLTVQAPPLYIQEKIHPKSLVEDLIRESRHERDVQNGNLSLFSVFNGISPDVDKTDFYQHDQNWTNRMILGDSLQVMASLAEREGMRGKVQCIYIDPPYGIKFNSNFQWSTTCRDVKDGKLDNMTREPEQVKAFRDTWRDGIHSYLSYLRDRFLLARDLLTESGSLFVQIGDENVHLVRILLDEIFGEKNFVSQIAFLKTSGSSSSYIENTYDYILWFSKNLQSLKYNKLFYPKPQKLFDEQYTRIDNIRQKLNNLNANYMPGDMSSQGASDVGTYPIIFEGRSYELPPNSHWKPSKNGMLRLIKADRIVGIGKRLRYKRFADDYSVMSINNLWNDTGISGFSDAKIYVVQTIEKVIQRCILMSTDPGDLVLDPTCGSGTTAYVAEQWGRRWITIDTSRVALALSRARIMGARYPYYLIYDSTDGKIKEFELKGIPPSREQTFNNIKLGFVYERIPHITLKSIANNTELDVIYERWEQKMVPLKNQLNKLLNKQWEEWEIPREPDSSWSNSVHKLYKEWWDARIERQKEIDASIAAHADYELLYDKPFEDKKKVRVAGPFTVESLSPHRTLGVGVDGELIDPATNKQGEDSRDFVTMILDNLKIAGVQQSHKEDKINFISFTPWPGDMICAEGHYMEGERERRAGIFIGPEFGTVNREDLVQAAREVADAGFDILITCAFNYEASTTEFNKLGKVPVIKARMNVDLHMGSELKSTGKGNLFVIFGEPDISIINDIDKNGKQTGKIKLKLNGVDVFYPNTGEIRSNNTDGIACWFIDTDYNEESFFVRQAYFPGTSTDPYKLLKITLKSEIDKNIWSTLNSSVSRPFSKPEHGRIAVKVINHLGDEVLKVFKV